jgi:tRNA pseudouridine38-40 synthase
MRFALGIEYDGTAFLGWQRLRDGATVQAEVENALSFVADAPIRVICAGRTDAGVHARCQVAHFDSDADRDPRAWQLGANSRLPRAVAVLWARAVDPDFHARFSACARRYRYRIVNRGARAALDARYATWERMPLDVDAMQRAAQVLVGEHDFGAFRSVACQSRTPNREVREIRVERRGSEVVIEIEANAFLHHMVRNIVGSLLPVGRGERPLGWIGELLHGRDRDRAGPTAPAQGLVFLGPRYPSRFGIDSVADA